ncbi:MAG: LpxI family protein [bacterium]|nr:LpxI family protein [bacterium]MCP5066242.1 LpxI family protein [bacterium]
MEVVGLIAGLGRMPIEVARAARQGGRRVVAVGLRGLTEASLAEEVENLVWVHVGEVEPMMACFRDAGAGTLVMAGKVPKTFLWEQPELVKPDARALRALSGLADRKDDSLLGAFADLLVEEGFSLLGQVELAPALLAEVGTLGCVQPGPAELADIAFGWPIAKAIGALDVGQTVVVKGRAILALEAVEGTDAAVERGCALGEPGASVVKVAKPAQDMRFDVPTIGLATLQVLVDCGAKALAVEAGKTVMLERKALLALADRHGIAVVGFTDGMLEAGEGEV